MVHEIAAAGFSDPRDYEAARPTYPPEAVQWFTDVLGIAPNRRVCDLAAGTGKLTRLLVPTGATLCAIEPVAGMRALLRVQVPGVPIVAGTAEAIPLRDASLDALVAAQAWHWFDHARAVDEARRVLRTGGGLGIVWNARDRSEPWIDEVWTIMDRVERRAPWRDHDEDRRDAFANLSGFGPLLQAQFRHTQPVTPADVVRRIASVSHVAVLPPRERAAVLDEVSGVLAHHPYTAGRNDLELVYRTDCFATLRV